MNRINCQVNSMVRFFLFGLVCYSTSGLNTAKLNLHLIPVQPDLMTWCAYLMTIFVFHLFSFFFFCCFYLFISFFFISLLNKGKLVRFFLCLLDFPLSFIWNTVIWIHTFLLIHKMSLSMFIFIAQFYFMPHVINIEGKCVYCSQFIQ